MEVDHQSAQFILDVLSFLFDRWEFLLGLVFGGAGSSYVTYKVVIKKKNKAKITQEGQGNQATEVVDSPNATLQKAGGDALRQDGPNATSTIIKGNHGATFNIGSIQTVADEAEALGPTPVRSISDTVALNLNQNHIFKKVQEVLLNLGVQSNFAERYKNAIAHLNNNSAQVSASEYHSAFHVVAPIFLERTTYGEDIPPEENINTFRDSFDKIKEFMSNSSQDPAELKENIERFEKHLLILLGYL